MNTKILVEVYVPELDIKYNVFIPAARKIANVVVDLIKGITELSEGAYPVKLNHALMNADTCEIYNTTLTFKDAHIMNGTKLLLI